MNPDSGSLTSACDRSEDLDSRTPRTVSRSNPIAGSSRPIYDERYQRQREAAVACFLGS
jgi:hypothetical protein